MAQKLLGFVGQRVARKRDGATGTVTKRQLVGSPGRIPSTVVTVKYDVPTGNDQYDYVGGLSAFRSFFKAGKALDTAVSDMG